MEEQPHRHQKKKRNWHHRRLSLLILLHESRTTSKERWEISHPRKVEASLPDLAGIIVETTSKVDDPQTRTHYATDIYEYLRSLELNEKAIRWKTTRIQYKQPQFTSLVSCKLARWQSVGFGISEEIPKMPAGGAHTEADVAPSWENQHRKAF
ncbi:uncharacterized protein LOC135625905 isoform X1 [Musa acuminata AAA Group]|uniref:uncharacterized protein LOC135625905 isoform X1 n=1 Tax=Musa acuminata AAA Group TaxID=214697 RepID=UPI0031D5263C